MIRKLLGIILLSPTILAQMEIRPDVSFSDTNDRFDLSGMMDATNRMFKDIPLADDDDESGEADFRRQFNDGIEIPQLTDLLKKKYPANIFPTRKADSDFAYHDQMISNEGGSMTDFEENLKNFRINVKSASRRNPHDDNYIYGFKKYRRSKAKDQDILLHHAVPIVMKVDGYLKAPLL